MIRAVVVLPVPRGPGEQVCLPLATLGDRRTQSSDDVVLTLQFGESAGPIAAVQRLGGHRRSPYRREATRPDRGLGLRFRTDGPLP